MDCEEERKDQLEFFKCDPCKKEFVGEEKLKMHMINDHIKSKKCQKCEKVFENSMKLKSHILLVHEKNSKCNICEQYFSKLKLNEHISNVHNMSDISKTRVQNILKQRVIC